MVKNKKNVLACICALAGVILLIYCIFSLNSGLKLISNGMLKSTVLLPVTAVFMLVSGIIGICVSSRRLRGSMYILTVIAAIGALCVNLNGFFTAYPAVIISAIALIVHFMDKSPEKKLFFVQKDNDIQLAFSETRPRYEDIVKDKKNKKAKTAKKVDSKPSLREQTAKSRITYERPSRVKKKAKPHAGRFAKAPNGKNFKYKKKR